MMRTARQPMTIPAIAPVDNLGLFLVEMLGSLSGLTGTVDVVGWLIIDEDGVIGGTKYVDVGGDTVEIGSKVVVVAVGDNSLVVGVVPTGVLVVAVGEGGVGMNVVTGEGTSGASVAIGVSPGPWKTVTVSVTGVVNWPLSSNCLSFNPRAAVAFSILRWAVPLSLLCHLFLLYLACILAGVVVVV